MIARLGWSWDRWDSESVSERASWMALALLEHWSSELRLKEEKQEVLDKPADMRAALHRLTGLPGNGHR